MESYTPDDFYPLFFSFPLKSASPEGVRGLGVSSQLPTGKISRMEWGLDGLTFNRIFFCPFLEKSKTPKSGHFRSIELKSIAI